MFGCKDSPEDADDIEVPESEGEVPPTPDRVVTLLIIAYRKKSEWTRVFDGTIFTTDSGTTVMINSHRLEWKDIWAVEVLEERVDEQVESRVVVHPRGGMPIKPDFVLFRQLICGLKKRDNWVKEFMAFYFSGIPCVNSLESVYKNLERAVVWNHLRRIQRREGEDVFPLILQNFYTEPCHRQFLAFPPPFPLVLKFGNVEAGYGKIMVEDSSTLKDVAGCMTVHDDFVTAEPLMRPKTHDLRIQKIGAHYRAYRRVSTIGSWKTNQGSSVLTEVEVLERWKKWADLVAEELDMNILTVDAIANGEEEQIIEINGSPSGFWEGNLVEDQQHVKEVVIEKMKRLF